MKRNTKTVVWALSQIMAAVLLTSGLFLSAGCNSKGTRSLHILVTGDVHGSWFDRPYVGEGQKTSLISAKTYIDSVRNSVGGDNVLLIDAGDCLQGDNAPYYFNYVATDVPHLYPRLASYIGYDAVVVGNHDIETGHDVYDRVAAQMRKMNLPWLASNAIRTSDGKPYFQEYAVFRRAGLKVLVLGFTNPNIGAWLDEKKWSGMEFESLIPYVQQRVDAIKARVKPDVTVVAVHSGTGEGDGTMYENQGLDLLGSLTGVDVLICAHDHRPMTRENAEMALVDAGSHCRNLGHAVVNVELAHGKVVSKAMSTELIRMDKEVTDDAMREEFREDYEAVRAFTLSPVGKMDFDIRTRDSYTGRAPYTDFIHTVQLHATKAQISFAAPLTFNAFISNGTLVYNDLFTIYPYENQLFVVNLPGSEIKDYLEESYDKWIQTWDGGHLLKISQRNDERTQSMGWSFDNRSYNFDSAAGINYTVDVTAAAGERISISSLADGTPFDPQATYSVAMTSYRCSGYGWDDNVIAKYREIREFIYDYLKEKEAVTLSDITDKSLLGDWKFIPEDIAGKALAADMALLFK